MDRLRSVNTFVEALAAMVYGLTRVVKSGAEIDFRIWLRIEGSSPTVLEIQGRDIKRLTRTLDGVAALVTDKDLVTGDLRIELGIPTRGGAIALKKRIKRNDGSTFLPDPEAGILDFDGYKNSGGKTPASKARELLSLIQSHFKLTQAELAGLAGIAVSTVSMITNGHRVISRRTAKSLVANLPLSEKFAQEMSKVVEGQRRN